MLTELPNGITTIGDSAFAGCSNLALTSLPSGIISLGSQVFQDCTKLALLELPSGITSLGLQAFLGCKNIVLTSLPNGITSIGNFAFNDCISIKSLVLGSNITSIGSSAFSGCSNLEYILCETQEVANLVKGKGRADSYIYSMQTNGYADGTTETEVVISDSVTIYTAEVDGYKWVRTSDNKYFKCIVAS